MKEMTLHFQARGYPLPLLLEAALKARRANRADLLFPPPKNTEKEERSILITTFDPHLDPVRDIVTHNWDILGKNKSTLPVFERKPMVAYRRPPNLKYLLVRANCGPKKVKSHTSKKASKATHPPFDLKKLDDIKFTEAKTQTSILSFFKKTTEVLITSASAVDLRYTPGNPPAPSASTEDVHKVNKTCYNNKCRICPILDTTGSFKCTVTQRMFTSKYNVTCQSSNLIYCITCRTCLKQYVGQTSNTLTQRFYSHFHNIKHKTLKDGVSVHFTRPDHKGFKDFQLHVLDFIRLPPKSDRGLALRLKIEKGWIHRLRCPAPRGLNLFD